MGFFNSALAVEARAKEPTALPLVEPRLLVPRSYYYPVLSLRLGEAGRVLLRYKVDANGRPESVSVALSESARLEAAEKGDLDEQRWLCSQFAYWNRITDPHPEKSCEMGVHVGDPYSEAMLADLYYVGRGVSLDYEGAFQLYRDSAARGLDFAQLMLGAMYILGRGVPEDRETGLAWLRRSMQSNPDAPTS